MKESKSTAIQKPDYETWSKMDIWKFKEAAMLLQGIEPLEHSAIKFTVSLARIPQELHRAYRIYLIFQSASWDHHFAKHEPNYDAHPFDILLEAHQKDIEIPAELMQLMITRIKRESSNYNNQEKYQALLEIFSINANNKDDFDAQDLSTRERNNFLRAIGVLSQLLIDEKQKSNRNQRNQKISASTILQWIIEKAEILGIETGGLKSFDRKITEALELIEEETEPSD